MRDDNINQFHLFLENSLEPIIGINDKGSIRFVNSSAEEVFGWKKSEALGKQVIELIAAPSEQKKLAHHIELALKDYESIEKHPFKILARHPRGVQFSIFISLSSIKINNAWFLYAFIKDVVQTKNSIFELKQSEERYRQLVESIKDYAIFMLDKTGIIISWNSGAEKIKGYRSEEIIGKHFSIFYSKEDVETGKPSFALKVAISDGKFEEENWRVRKDGTLFWANVLITPLWEPDGKLQGFAKVTRDLTAKKQSEEALKQSQERYRILFDNLPDYAIFMLDKKGRIVSWNKGAKKITGYQNDEIVGESFEIFSTDEDKKTHKFKKILNVAVKSGKYEEESWYIAKNKSKFCANTIINYLSDSSGPISFSVLMKVAPEMHK